MAQNYRIYINDNTLFIADLMPKQIKKIQQVDVQQFDFQIFYKNLARVSGKDYILLDPDPKKLFKKIRKSCEMIKAAGGLVKECQRQVTSSSSVTKNGTCLRARWKKTKK